MPGLYVVEQAADFATVRRELRRLDDRLDLTYEMERGRQVYRVLCEYAGGKVAVLCEWRDQWGFPLPLSSGLVEQVRSQRNDGVDYTALNAAKVEAEVREFEANVDEAVSDVGPRIDEKRSAVLPRGVHLRRARDRRRARGEQA